MDALRVYRFLLESGRLEHLPSKSVGGQIMAGTGLDQTRAQLAMNTLTSLMLLQGERRPRSYRWVETSSPSVERLLLLREEFDRADHVAIVLSARNLITPKSTEEEVVRHMRRLFPGIRASGIDVNRLARRVVARLPSVVR